MAKWRVWYEDKSVNGEHIIPALQCAMPSEITADTAAEAAEACAKIHGFKGNATRQTYVCVHAEKVEKVTLSKDPRPSYSVVSP